MVINMKIKTKYFLNINLFFLVMLFSSAHPLAASSEILAEKKITVIQESTDSMANIMSILGMHHVNLHETAFFFDFDETIATKIAYWNEHTYHVIASPDLYRTYGEPFRQAFSELGLDKSSDPRLLEPTDTLEYSSHYAILDDDIIHLIQNLKSAGAHVGVCSALPANQHKLDILRKVGIDPNDYTYASGGKAKTIELYLQHHLLGQRISTIVLNDNSFKYAIQPYISSMGNLAKEVPQTKDAPEIKIIGIEFTKFNKMATPQKIKEELENMRKSFPSTSSSSTYTTEDGSTF